MLGWPKTENTQRIQQILNKVGEQHMQESLSLLTLIWRVCLWCVIGPEGEGGCKVVHKWVHWRLGTPAPVHTEPKHWSRLCLNELRRQWFRLSPLTDSVESTTSRSQALGLADVYRVSYRVASALIIIIEWKESFLVCIDQVTGLQVKPPPIYSLPIFICISSLNKHNTCITSKTQQGRVSILVHAVPYMIHFNAEIITTDVGQYYHWQLQSDVTSSQHLVCYTTIKDLKKVLFGRLMTPIASLTLGINFLTLTNAHQAFLTCHWFGFPLWLIFAYWLVEFRAPITNYYTQVIF